MNDNEARMSFFEHLQELRVCLIRAFVAIGIAFCACLGFSKTLYDVLASPIMKELPKDSPLVFISVVDPFFVYIKIAFFAGLTIALPYALYQLWRFIYPGLHPHERKLAAPFVISAAVLFYVGATFAYFLVFGPAFRFFLSYQDENLKAMIEMRKYVSFVLSMMLAFGAVFETPIIIVFLGLIGIFKSDTLKKGRRYFIVIAFIIAAILTPTPDVVNQTIMAVPMILFYEVGVQILVLLERKRKREEEREQLDAAHDDEPM